MSTRGGGRESIRQIRDRVEREEVSDVSECKSWLDLPHGRWRSAYWAALARYLKNRDYTRADAARLAFEEVRDAWWN